MREIKFRTPYKCTECGHFNYLFFYLKNNEILEREFLYDSCGCPKETTICGDDEQFTGLLDKNGKEIYEGDIIEYKSSNFRGIVKYHTSPETRFYLDGYDFGKKWHELHATSDLEIIGNKFENPELIEEPNVNEQPQEFI